VRTLIVNPDVLDHRSRWFPRVIALGGLAIAALVSGCSALPGLAVLTGQEPSGEAAQIQTVQALDLVMADKTGSTDPSLTAAADRIEAASSDVDVIEIRSDLEQRIFNVSMLFRPPSTDNSMEGQIAFYDSLRRAIELTWQGTMRDSEGTDLIQVTLLVPQPITTLDNGESYVGAIVAETEIERGQAASYLAGSRSLTTFFDLIAQGTLNYVQLDSPTLYEGTPNHPMFMLSG
jgi:hypothetical protein